MRNVLIVQQYVPHYRSEFFRQLESGLRDQGVHLTLAAGVPSEDSASRQDHDPGVATVPLEIKTSRLGLRSYGSSRLARRHDAVVYEASASLVDVNLALLSHSAVGLWGPFLPELDRRNRRRERIQRWQVGRAGTIFAYTGAGQSQAVAWGAHPDQVVTLNNTVDTSGLRRETAAMTTDRARSIVPVGASPRETTFAYIGALDGPKRVAFLIRALDRLWKLDTRIRLVVAGDGVDRRLLDPCVQRGQVVFLGRAGNEEKAALALTCTAILMPGRVGLVAVDSFVLGLPIITTEWPHHAPEVAYLRPGHDSMRVADDPEVFARAVLELSLDNDVARALQENAMAKSGQPTLEFMVEAFCAGVDRLLGQAQTSSGHSTDR